MAFLFVTSGTTTGFQSNTGTSTFDAIAGGGGGAAGSTGGGTQASAGGGGAWAQNTAITWTQSQNCAIGGGGAGGTAQGSGSISSAQNGANGTKSWCRTDNGAASIPTTSGQGVAADLGVGGSINPTTTGGTGGLVANSVGTNRNAGGSGATASNSTWGGTGAGGAGGSGGTGGAGGTDNGNGAERAGTGGGANGGGGAGSSQAASDVGGAGGTSITTANQTGHAGGAGGSGGTTATAGGTGTAGSGGGGGGGIASGANTPGAGGVGGAGTEYDATHGSGGGSGGGGGNEGTANAAGAGNTGGNYGGGGGASGLTASTTNTAAGGAAAPGIVVITYTAAGAFVFQYFDGVSSSPDAYPRVTGQRFARQASIMQGDQGTQARFQRFVPYFEDLQDTLRPNPAIPNLKARAGAIMQGDQGTQDLFRRFFIYTFDLQDPLRPNPGTQNLKARQAAIMVGDQGIQDIQRLFFPYIWRDEVTNLMPRWLPKARASMTDIGDQGTQARFVFVSAAVGWGWEIASYQPQYRRYVPPEQGDQGNYTPIVFRPYGWEVPSLQPPHPRPERFGSIVSSAPGIEAQFIFTPTIPPMVGWEIAPPVLRAWPTAQQRWSGRRGSSQFGVFSPFQPYGWEIPPPQPPHPRPERSGAIMPSELGIEARFVFTPTTLTWGWETPSQMLRNTYNRAQAAFGVSDFISFFFQPYGWEIASPQPPHPRFERAGAIMPSEPGIEAQFVFTPPTVIFFTFEQPPLMLKHPRYINLDYGDQGTASRFVRFQPYGWEVPPPLTRYKAFRSPEIGDQGIAQTFQVFRAAGWEIQPFQPPHPRPERAGSIMPSEPGIEAQFVFTPATPVIWGFEGVAPHLRNPISRYPALEGHVDFAFFDFVPYGWEIAPPQPPHPRFEKAGAIMPSEPGIEAQFVFTPTTPVIWGWEIVPPLLVPQPRVHRRGAIIVGDQGTQSPFVTFLPFSWSIPSHQPGHPRPERAGAIMVGDAGIQSPLLFTPYGWELAPFQPPHPKPERNAAWMIGDQGTQAQFVPPPVVFAIWGWDPQPFIPVHPRPERFAATIGGGQGTELPTLFLPYGWEIAPYQPPHPRPERVGAIMPSELGISQRFQLFLPYGWEIAPFQPPHPRAEKAGSIMVGDQGTYSVFVFVPPPLPTGHSRIYIYW